MAPADITLVVATYNRPGLLHVELESILASAAQVKAKVRVLVVDDHSHAIHAKRVAARFGVDYLRLPRNVGVAGCLYAGFQQVDSPYYALWGDDDYMLLDWFSLHLARIEEGYDVVSGSYVMVDAALDPIRLVELPLTTVDALMDGRVYANDGSLVRRDSLGDITFHPERERAMMMTFWLAMAHAGKRFSVIEEPTWLYRRHRGQLSARRPSPHDMSLRHAAIAQYAR